MSILFLWIIHLGFSELGSSGSTTTHLAGCFAPGQLSEYKIEHVTFILYRSCLLDSLLGYSNGEFQVLQMIILVVFGVVD